MKIQKFVYFVLLISLTNSLAISSNKQISLEDEMIEARYQDQNQSWNIQLPSINQENVDINIEEDRYKYRTLPQNLGGNFMCGTTAVCASLLGIGGGIVYLYAKYPVFVVNTLLETLAPPILVGAGIAGSIGCGVGYFIKKNIDEKNRR